MPVIQTERLRGAALEWATALAEGHIDDRNSRIYQADLEEFMGEGFHPVSSAAYIINTLYSGDVASITRLESGMYMAAKGNDNCIGATPGEAVCRLIVLNRFGQTVEVTDEVFEYQMNLEKENHG